MLADRTRSCIGNAGGLTTCKSAIGRWRSPMKDVIPYYTGWADVGGDRQVGRQHPTTVVGTGRVRDP